MPASIELSLVDRDLWRFERACQEADLARVLRGEQRWALLHDDCLQALRLIPDCSVDSIVTDPPSAIRFMGNDWDSDRGGRAMWVQWLTLVMAECLRALKPGGHAFVWALPRKSHWTGLAIEQAGFEVRDVVSHLFGTGMPKSLNVSKGIDRKMGTTSQRRVLHTYQAGGNAGTSTKDKGGTYSVGAENSEPIELAVTAGGCDESRAWDGYGTGLKPSAEFWFLARKPFKGTLVDNVLTHGCGCLHIDACRVSTDWTERPPSWHASGHSAKPTEEKIAAPPGAGIQCHPAGRWPTNVVLSHSDGCGERCAEGCPIRELDGQSGFLRNGGSNAACPDTEAHLVCYGRGRKHGNNAAVAGDVGFASRFFPQFRASPLDDIAPFLYQAKPSRRERDTGCEHLPKKTRGQATRRKDGTAALDFPRTGAGRSGGARNSHATVKGVELMRWLVRLVTRPGGICLDPFAGSGTTGVACMLERIRFIGIEMYDTDEFPYCTIARARLHHASSWKPPKTETPAEMKQRSLFDD
jgi:site-specific DNA-methyltransferase (adenine-specific)